eukprot:6868355-Alexandrium_andersonii.AAC.1
MAPRLRGSHGAEIGTALAPAPTRGRILAGRCAKGRLFLQPSTASSTCRHIIRKGNWQRNIA